MSVRIMCTLKLPANFRPEHVLAFHRRDPEEIAERVTDGVLQKGLVWAGRPAQLTLYFRSGQVAAELAIDGTTGSGSDEELAALVRRMLGLTQDVESFESRFREHPQLGRLIAGQPGLRVPVAATPFEALSWAIIGQQISVGAALSMRRKMIVAAGLQHSSGLFCCPAAEQLIGLDASELRQAGLSISKARTLLELSESVVAGRLPLDAWAESLPVADIRAKLLAVLGIGPWTVNYTLLRGFGWLDGSLHGDSAVRRGLQLLLGRSDKVGDAETKAWLAEFSPWRALVAAHLWAVKSVVA
jgi:DNA-3-methyladenine glycosylase II